MWTPKLRRFAKIAEKHGAVTEEVQGKMIDFVSEERESLIKVSFQCTKGEHLTLTLDENTSEALLVKVSDSELDLDEDMIEELAHCYNKSVEFNK